MSQLPRVRTSAKVPKAEAVVVGVVEQDDEATLVIPEALQKAWAKRKVPTYRLNAEAGAIAVVTGPAGDELILVGIGKQVTPAAVRRAAGSAVRFARKAKFSSLALALPTEEPELLAAVTEGALLGTYRPHTLKKDAAEDENPAPSITVVTSGDASIVEQTQVVTDAIVTARDLVNLPANLLYPETFAERARQLVTGTKITTQVLDDQQLAAEGYGGLTAVGGGSAQGPRLVRLSYAPRGAKTHLALVGKGVTFDSGGLDIKPPDAMYTMKCDMAGAAAVIAAIRAIADLGLKVRVTAYAPMAENMPSATAYRPSDVLTIYGGLTVENANTDAEGRLILADALARATEDAPDIVVDVATLTGACMVALGQQTAGLVTDDDGLADRMLGAAESAGESCWRLPLTEEASKSLASPIADVRSSGKSRYGGALVAAAFLRKFVPQTIAWGHLDIAGPAWRDESDAGPDTSGGTGYGVRTLVELARSLAS